MSNQHLNELRIAIVGGTGTVGKNLAKDLLGRNPDQSLLIYSRDEVKQLDMMREFPEDNFPKVDFMIGDIRDKERLVEATEGHDIVINAAAIKHVVIAEKNPDECLKTNVDGTRNVIEACIANKVKKCLLISTDKAVQPQGVYGHSKQQSEELMLEANAKKQCKFSVVRFGNIIGSRASVSEIFRKMVDCGELKITDIEATRFGIRVDEAIGFLVSKIEEMNGGEIFSPKMKAFKVVDLAKAIAPKSRLAFIGLRPGDKLHEVMSDALGNLIHSNETEIMTKEEIVKALEYEGGF